MKLSKEDLKTIIMEYLNEVDPSVSSQQPVKPSPQPSAPTPTPQPEVPSPQNSNLSTEIQSIFSKFQQQLTASENLIIRKKEDELKNLLVGKMIRTRASIGYKNVEKEYEINVKDVRLVFYYEEYVIEVSGAEKSAKKDKDYILNKALDVEIVSNEPKTEPVPIKPTTPVVTQKPVTPTINPVKQPSSGQLPTV